MTICWPKSSAKHGIPQSDALYAMQHAIFTSTKVDVAPELGDAQRRVFIGPAHGQTERLLEVLVEFLPHGDFRVYHVMELGSKYRRLMEEEK